ncbi:hypothetical protein ABZP36_025572 [Zizania latifolia]
MPASSPSLPPPPSRHRQRWRSGSWNGGRGGEWRGPTVVRGQEPKNNVEDGALQAAVDWACSPVGAPTTVPSSRVTHAMTLLTSPPLRRAAVSSTACVLGACGVGISGGRHVPDVRWNTTAETYVSSSRKYIALDYLVKKVTATELEEFIWGRGRCPSSWISTPRCADPASSWLRTSRSSGAGANNGFGGIFWTPFRNTTIQSNSTSEDASTCKYLLALTAGYSEKANVDATGHKSSSEETGSMDRAKAVPVREDVNDNDVSCVDDTALLLSSSGRDGQLIYFRCTNHLNHLGWTLQQ